MSHEPQILTPSHAGELLTLQRAAFVTEAIAHNDLTLPPLRETLDEVAAQLAAPDVIVLGIQDEGRLVASVRLHIVDEAAELGRLMVAPDRQGHGLGTRLIQAVDAHLPPQVRRVDLFTGEKSVGNIRLYEREGFVEIRRESIGAYNLVHMSRPRR